MKFSDYQAIIFDLDGTLADSMWIWQDIDIEYLEKYECELPADLQKKIEGMSTTETAIYFKETFNIKDDIETIKAEWIEMAKDYYAHKIHLKKGAKELLEYLSEQGFSLGIGTSNFRELAEVCLENRGIKHYFKTIRTSCEFQNGKPFPDVFLGVAEDLGVAPEKCLVFEDTHAGVIAAKRAGMDVIAIKDASSEPYFDKIEKDVMMLIDDFTGLYNLERNEQ